MENFNISSEIGLLKSVLVHKPELSMKRLTPSNCKKLLFDDVLSVEKAEIEHKYFCQVLQENGSEVLVLQTLLEETLSIKEAREWLFKKQFTQYRFGASLQQEVIAALNDLNVVEIARFIIGGMTVKELKNKHKNLVLSTLKENDFIIEPTPNLLFTRDSSCWIYGGVSLNPMAKLARKRETSTLGAIYKFHPIFKKNKFIFYNEDNVINYDNTTFEGGDILVIGNKTVLIGLSERTSPQGIEHLAQALFATEQADKLIAVQLPKNRSYMHLDTLLTQLTYDCFSFYPKVNLEQAPCWELTPLDNKIIQTKLMKKGLFHTIANSLKVDALRMIPTGGDVFTAEREQWNDANNFLAISPGKVIGYDCNIHTIKNVEKNNIEIIAIQGDQLGRGRGGPRCMTCPLLRAPI